LKDKNGYTAFYLVFQRLEPDYEVIKLLLNVGGMDLVTTKYKDDHTILHEACSNGRPCNVIELVLKIGGKQLAMMTDSNGCTALHHACESGSDDIVKLLLDLGGYDLAILQDSDDATALHIACGNDTSIELINLLLDVGGEDIVTLTDTDGFTALHMLCQFHSEKLRMIMDVSNQMMIKLGDDYLQLKTNQGETAFDILANERRDNLKGTQKYLMKSSTDNTPPVLQILHRQQP